MDELAELLAFDFDAGPIPELDPDLRPDDPENEVLSTCSTLITIVDQMGVRVVQFTHFTVKEYLTSSRLVEGGSTICRRFHISITRAHTLVTQACLGILLQLYFGITRNDLLGFPLVYYAAAHWFRHARFETVWENVKHGIKQLLDPGNPQLAIWVRLYDVGPRHGGRKPPLRLDGSYQLGATPLHYAALCGLPELVETMAIEDPQHVHSQDLHDESTPLHRAASMGHVQVASILIDHGADVNARTKDRSTPLHVASERGHLEFVRFLLKCGADVTAQNNVEQSPLHWALRGTGPNLELARILLEGGADPNARDYAGYTPLHLASCKALLDFMHLLLDYGADVSIQDNNRRTPLSWAAMMERDEASRILIEHGADPKDHEKFTRKEFRRRPSKTRPSENTSRDQETASAPILLRNIMRELGLRESDIRRLRR